MTSALQEIVIMNNFINVFIRENQNIEILKNDINNDEFYSLLSEYLLLLKLLETNKTTQLNFTQLFIPFLVFRVKDIELKIKHFKCDDNLNLSLVQDLAKKYMNDVKVLMCRTSEGEHDTCPICFEEQELRKLECNHQFCNNCLCNIVEKTKSCPICSGNIYMNTPV